MDVATPSVDARLARAKVLVRLRELHDAERLVAEVLDEDSGHITALSLFARIKHMRGELSAAVACWTQIHARAPHNEWALSHLEAMLQLARDPERGAQDFLALGPFQLVRKSTAHLGLEEAFRLFLQRRPDAARARCENLAAKHQDKDREVYKLAVLANAWLAELSGEFEDARQQLERLGTERGFETDLDRLLALIRVYDRLGTRESLLAAVNICHHLEGRFEKLTVLSQLASLYRRLGEKRRAAEYDERHLDAFRRRMHRPTFAELVQVAAQSYLPLEQLISLAVPATELPESAPPRERALGSALRGDVAGARRFFKASKELLDQKYLADVAALDGRTDAAVRGHLAALRADPSDVRLLGWVLDKHAVDHAPQLTELLRDAEAGPGIQRVLEAAIDRTPLRASLWRQLAAFHRLRGNVEEAARSAQRAEALVQSSGVTPPVGRVLSAAVYRLGRKSKGLIHEVWAGRQPTLPNQGGWLAPENIFGNLSSEMREGVRNTFLAVREYARAKLPHHTHGLMDFHYSYKLPKEDEQSGGLSAGLPTALAFLSVFMQRPVPNTIASSGVVVADAHDVLTVRPVGDAEYKVKAAYHRDLATLILPLGCRATLRENAQVPHQICQEMVQYVQSLDEAVVLVFGPDIFKGPR